MAAGSAGMLRIGELSRRIGVSVHVLRAWERRYGLLRPERSPGGYRLYSETDELRVKVMRAHLARGLSTAEAARATLRQMPVTAAEPPAPDAAAPHGAGGGRTGPGGGRPAPGITMGTSPPRTADRGPPPHADVPEPAAGDRLAEAIAALVDAMQRLDEPSAQTIIDRALARFTAETVVRDIVLPSLRALGEGWRCGEMSVAQEHFGSNLLRARLMHLARGWGRGRGPRALLACAPGELHDIGLLTFGVMLYRAGWRIAFLGANVPVEVVIETAAGSPPDLVVVSAVTPERFAGLEPGLRRLARVAPLALGGHGATPRLARAVGARLLPGDAVTEAEVLSSHGGVPGTTGA